HFSSSDGQATLPADYTFTGTDSGAHTFSATLTTAGSQSLTATDTSNSSISGSQTGITVNPAAAKQLAFLQQSSNTVAGSAIAPAVSAQVQDQYGNVVTSSTATITMAIGTNAGGGTLSGTTSVSASGGIATFNNL